MKIKDGFVLRQISDNYMVVPLGTQVKGFASIIKLNESGAFLWSLLSEDKTTDELVKAVISEYDVDETTATRSIEKFIAKLSDADILE